MASVTIAMLVVIPAGSHVVEERCLTYDAHIYVRGLLFFLAQCNEATGSTTHIYIWSLYVQGVQYEAPRQYNPDTPNVPYYLKAHDIKRTGFPP